MARDFNEVADWFEKAAKHGNREACYEMGQICRFGNQDMDKATEWYQKGVGRGHPGCCCQLGFRHFWKDNNIVKQDYRKALELFEKAIEGGIPLGYYGAGRVYFSGLSGKPDYKKALEMFEEGARLGDLDSVYYIGYCYRNGLGVKVDKEKAVQCYLKSSGG